MIGKSREEAPQPQTRGSRRGCLDDESREWLRSLGSTGVEREQALARLHAMLLRVARAELQRRNRPGQVDGGERDDLAHQAADDALLAIISKLDGFRGDSRFTTWAYKFVVFEVSAKLGRHFRRDPAILIGADAWERIPDRFGAAPAQLAESRELATALRRAVNETLSDRQRHAFVAIVVEGISLDTLVIELGSTRNAIYKMMFDARRKVRAYLVANGYLDDRE